MLADERDHLAGGRSSSAAGKADAALRISPGLAQPAFSLQPPDLCISADVVPGHWPASTSARRTYLRSVSAVPMPSFLATAQIAAYCEG
jgi:hypothetical protein